MTTKTISTDTKKKIFSLYFQQQILQTSYAKSIHKGNLYNVTPNQPVGWELLVRPVERITKEHLKKMCEIGDGCFYRFYDIRSEQINLIEDDLYSLIAPFYISPVIDYLRSEGYAVPAFGYSVFELIQLGVFTLKIQENDTLGD